MSTPQPVDIRWLIRRDMREVLAIENACFQFPWTEEEFLLQLREKNCIGCVAEKGFDVLGYMIYELHKSTLRLPNLAVHPAYQRRSIGTQMISRLVDKLSQQRRARLTVEVRESNVIAQQFLQSCGMRAVSVNHGRYEETGEDAYEFVYSAVVPLVTSGSEVR